MRRNCAKRKARKEAKMVKNDLAIVEDALKDGRLWIATHHGRYWQCRRNGKTQVWKTRPREFSIPIKAGFRACSRIEHDSWIGTAKERADFVISADYPR